MKFRAQLNEIKLNKQQVEGTFFLYNDLLSDNDKVYKKLESVFDIPNKKYDELLLAMASIKQYGLYKREDRYYQKEGTISDWLVLDIKAGKISKATYEQAPAIKVYTNPFKESIAPDSLILPNVNKSSIDISTAKQLSAEFRQ